MKLEHEVYKTRSPVKMLRDYSNSIASFPA